MSPCPARFCKLFARIPQLYILVIKVCRKVWGVIGGNRSSWVSLYLSRTGTVPRNSYIPLNQILCLIYRIVPKLLRHKMHPILGQNSRFMPGAIFAPIMAASIGMLPLPQNGSTKMRSSLHGVNKISAAAKVSVIGALELSLR